MSVTAATSQGREVRVGLSPKTLQLWLAAARYRRVADDLAGGVEADNTPDLNAIQITTTTDYDESLACQ